MPGLKSRVLSLAAATLVAVPAYAAAPSATSDTSNPTADQGATSTAQTTADRDFGRFSKDGAKAFENIDLARLAIFNGQTAQAQQHVQKAEAMLAKAKSDDTVFMKAESELKVPAGTSQRGPANATPGTTKMAWLPIGGTMTIGEDYTADKAKSAGVDKADAQMKQGDTKRAMETLKLNDIDVSFVEQVAPLDATLKGVEQASNLLSQDHYFAANQALKAVDDGVRVDEQSYVAAPDVKKEAAK